MEGGQPSDSAIGCAMLRAAHLLWDDPPKIFEGLARFTRPYSPVVSIRLFELGQD
jgi:hypothetical protein